MHRGRYARWCRSRHAAVAAGGLSSQSINCAFRPCSDDGGPLADSQMVFGSGLRLATRDGLTSASGFFGGGEHTDDGSSVATAYLRRVAFRDCVDHVL